MHFDSLAPVLVEDALLQIENVGEAVGRVKRHDNGSISHFSDFDTGRSSGTGLANPPLPSKKMILIQRKPLITTTFTHLITQNHALQGHIRFKCFAFPAIFYKNTAIHPNECKKLLLYISQISEPDLVMRQHLSLGQL
jgi:hypothetical protein